MDTKEIIVPYAASCRFLSDEGCALGDMKPFQCRLYPLLFLCDGSLGIDPACTYSGEYLSLLQDPASDACRHLEEMKKEASMLSEDEKRLLAEWSRYVCDVVALEDHSQH
jgi:Fe-S-cluster containining protein